MTTDTMVPPSSPLIPEVRRPQAAGLSTQRQRIVTAVLVVSFGRLGDMYGRVRMYNLGFAVFTVFSILLSVSWLHGTAGALWLIVMRVLQGVRGSGHARLRGQHLHECGPFGLAGEDLERLCRRRRQGATQHRHPAANVFRSRAHRGLPGS